MSGFAGSASLTITILAIALALALAAGTVLFLLWRRASTELSGREDRSVDLEHQRIDAELRLAEMTDRLRLITEVHDAAAGSLSQMISRAEGAKFSATSDPAAASRAAAAIADEARVVLGDLRRVVNTTRAEVDRHQDTERPSLVALDDLFGAMDQSGIVVKFEETGESFPVGSSAELAIFRIIQEALNNSRAHGGPGTTVKVTMAWSAQGMHLRIEDDGIRTQNRVREESGESVGYGIAEHQKALVEILDGRGMKDMRARTEAFGGVFSAHRVPGVGFNISSAFPTLRYHNGVHGVDTRGRAEGTPS